MTDLICGVDVSSAALDARLGRDGAVRRFGNDAGGVAELAAFKQHQVGLVALVALEATGGYERRAVAVLRGAGIPAAVVNPRAVRRFAEAMGFLEKTDRIDSGIIAWFAEVKRVAPQPPAGAAQRRLAALVTRLRQLAELRTAQMNQRRLVTDPTALGCFAELIGLIARQIKAIAEEIGKLIASDPLWRTLDLAWREIKGVADRTVARLMAELPEIATLSSKAVSKLAGLAPLARDSGKLNGNRPVRGGRSGPLDPVRGGRAGAPARPRFRCLPPPVDPGRQTEKSDPCRPRPQTARPPQRQGARCPNPTRVSRLTFQTAAHPGPLPARGERESSGIRQLYL